ncbi:MAG: hypothetical protein R2757_19975 [Draconibacterium sp.]
MNPIFTSNNERKLKGYWYDEFVSHFDSICKEHLSTGRAKKFAFIVYDFHSPTHEVLQNHGVFTELDRLSGKDITVFYLDGQLGRNRNNQTRLFRNMNEILLDLTGEQIRSIPFVVFFDFKDDDVSNLKCYTIREDEKFILHDLIKSVELELKSLQEEAPKKNTTIMSGLLKETPKILYTEFIKTIFKDIFEAK